MTAYYNEIDPYAAEWLRNLIAAGHIAPGVVDTRSIEDVQPADLQDFTQCHFFAGVGVWSLALRRAGWSDDRPVWTGSCPCQPFSAAGQGAGFADERHLWPAFHHLIRQLRPAVVLGEQVASKDADPWIDLVHTDMEALGYAFGAVPFPSAGIGAPHIRDRLYWVANAARPGSSIELGNGRQPEGRSESGCAGGMGYADRPGRQPVKDGPRGNGARVESPRRIAVEPGEAVGNAGGLADAIVLKRPGGESSVSDKHAAGGRIEGAAAPSGLRGDMRTGATNGYWAAADWLGCRDGKWRPVEPGTFPLAHGAPARVGRLRAYGNAINAEAARVFVEAVMEAA